MGAWKCLIGKIWQTKDLSSAWNTESAILIPSHVKSNPEATLKKRIKKKTKTNGITNKQNTKPHLVVKRESERIIIA